MKCREAYRPTAQQLAEAGFREETWDGIDELFRAVGCPACARTGYRGRLGLYEVMLRSEEIERLTVERSSSETIKRSAVASGMITLRAEGLERVRMGSTSIQEVLRVVS